MYIYLYMLSKEKWNMPIHKRLLLFSVYRQSTSNNIIRMNAHCPSIIDLMCNNVCADCNTVQSLYGTDQYGQKLYQNSNLPIACTSKGKCTENAATIEFDVNLYT